MSITIKLLMKGTKTSAMLVGFVLSCVVQLSYDAEYSRNLIKLTAALQLVIIIIIIIIFFTLTQSSSRKVQ